MDNANFLTLDELARELTMSLDNVRYRFKQLRQSGQLVEGQDYHRADYRNETNFVYRVNPSRFFIEAGLPSLASFRPRPSSSAESPGASASNEPPPASDFASATAGERAPASLPPRAAGSAEILHERLQLKEEQLQWRQEQLEETRSELTHLREERRAFTKALTTAFETIQELNSQVMALAAPARRASETLANTDGGAPSNDASDRAWSASELASDLQATEAAAASNTASDDADQPTFL